MVASQVQKILEPTHGLMHANSPTATDYPASTSLTPATGSLACTLAAVVLVLGVASRAPMSSMRLARQLSLAAFLSRFAITLGVGAFQGATTLATGGAATPQQEVQARPALRESL